MSTSRGTTGIRRIVISLGPLEGLNRPATVDQRPER